MMTDMTKGSPFKILLKFVLPMLLSMVFQQMYNLADSVIAGRYLGVDALAATGAAYPITVCNSGCLCRRNNTASV